MSVRGEKIDDQVDCHTGKLREKIEKRNNKEKL